MTDSSFMSLMNQGGPVMWVILVVAWLAIVMLIERSLRVFNWRKAALLAQHELDSNKDSNINQSQSPIGMVMKRINWTEIKDKDQLAEQLNLHLAELTPKLEGSLPTIAVIGSLLPMLGLLGTVTGMIEVFQVIAVQGSGDPQAMADGISQALLTTASGLIIAIPVIFGHHLLVRQLRYILTVTEQSMYSIYSGAEKRLQK